MGTTWVKAEEKASRVPCPPSIHPPALRSATRREGGKKGREREREREWALLGVPSVHVTIYQTCVAWRKKYKDVGRNHDLLAWFVFLLFVIAHVRPQVLEKGIVCNERRHVPRWATSRSKAVNVLHFTTSVRVVAAWWNGMGACQKAFALGRVARLPCPVLRWPLFHLRRGPRVFPVIEKGGVACGQSLRPTRLVA